MVVCAANRHTDGRIVLGVRHFDMLMQNQMGDDKTWRNSDQGFVDCRGNFLTREEAWVVASENGQIIRRVGGDGKKLFSENLY